MLILEKFTLVDTGVNIHISVLPVQTLTVVFTDMNIHASVNFSKINIEFCYLFQY